MENNADIRRPIVAIHVGPAPVVLRTIITENVDYMMGGVPQAALKAEDYILLSSLPRELQERIKTVVQALIDGM